MMIRKYNINDLSNINNLGILLHENYKFQLDEFSYCVVIEENKTFIGFVIYSIMYERAEIIDIIIDPLYRKKGYGQKILNFCIKDILSKNCINITLEVNSSNISAINLYKKLGFKIEAIRKKYYGNCDAYLMKKDLR